MVSPKVGLGFINRRLPHAALGLKSKYIYLGAIPLLTLRESPEPVVESIMVAGEVENIGNTYC